MGVLSMVKEDESGSERSSLTGSNQALRRQLATEIGFVMPPGAHPRQKAARAQRLYRPEQEVDAGRARHLANQLMVMDRWARRFPARLPHHLADLRPAGHLD